MPVAQKPHEVLKPLLGALRHVAPCTTYFICLKYMSANVDSRDEETYPSSLSSGYFLARGDSIPCCEDSFVVVVVVVVVVQMR